MAKTALRLPSRIGALNLGIPEKNGLRDSAWAVAYGLCILGVHADQDLPIDTSSRIFENSKKTLIAWIKQFLP
jgi:hypothetical protein